MRWFRSKPFGSWCALFALSVQLAFSFGHVHRGGQIQSVDASLLAEITGDLAQTTADPTLAAPARAPDAPRPADPAFDYCGICTVISLIGSMVPPATPALPLPVVVSEVLHWTNIDFTADPPRHVIFEARAPPQA